MRRDAPSRATLAGLLRVRSRLASELIDFLGRVAAAEDGGALHRLPDRTASSATTVAEDATDVQIDGLVKPRYHAGEMTAQSHPCWPARVILRGEVGSGKTRLLQSHARQLALSNKAMLEDRSSSLERVRIPLLFQVRQLSSITGPLEHAVTALLSPRYSSAFRNLVQEKLRNGDAVLILDDWHCYLKSDEVTALQRHFTELPATRVIVATRRRTPGGVPLADAVECFIPHLGWADVHLYAETVFGSNERARAFVWLLRRSITLRTLCRIPLMLAEMCLACRTERCSQRSLVSRCIARVLCGRAEAKSERMLGRAPDDHPSLGALARALFLDGKNDFTRFQFEAARDAVGEVQATLDDYVTAGLITPAEPGNGRFRFLDPSFHAYMTATAIAAMDGQQGGRSVAELLRGKEWLPLWPEVIVLLVSDIKSPAQLFEMISDDLPLLVTCFREVEARWLLEFPDYEDVVTAVCTKWANSLESGEPVSGESAWDDALLTVLELSHSNSMLMRPRLRLFATAAEHLVSLGTDSGRPDLVGRYLCEAVEARGRRKDATERYWAYHALGMMATDEAVRCLKSGLLDDNEFARGAAQQALRLVENTHYRV